LKEAGFIVTEGDSPIVPVMLYSAKLAQQLSQALFEGGVYAVGFFFPVVPQGQARIRTQLSAGHTQPLLERALAAFARAGKELGILGMNREGIVEHFGL
jgi:glycine C-acetyltransferase